ncbi:rho GTPase-activating protein 11A-like isoform X2 [Macrosteles quadrilineatus]|uniref:rho GTPase-activating protein 11A-like isoform X2 n=1 Tax=Macrosteles quadrilineatus TaxID=74068 RepID=UPI0023E116D6|nr:rho GTPase-activating protein 11A-like isoform X2 [Macrosteles quadrilineatus]
MFIAECDVEEVKGEAYKLLKKWGVKLRSKKFDLKTVEKKGVGVFKFHLEKLVQEKTKLPQYNQFINVPAFVIETCDYLRDMIETEGIFRKSGVAVRQKELKRIVMNGGKLSVGGEIKAYDVADLLKLFFRELPEPCIPYMFHDTLQRCFDNIDRRKEAVFLALLILPSVYLYTLAYLMQFLHEVAAHSQYNQMDASNLAIVWVPNLMPFKTGRVDDKQAFEKRLAIVQMLIEDAGQIGLVPECLYDHLPSWQTSLSLSSHDELEHSKHRYKKKKRRSGSLTRMISGIKKMVKNKVSEEVEVTTPDNSVSVAHTPRIMSTGKKRKASESNLTAFSTKKSVTRNVMGCEVGQKSQSRFYINKSEGERKVKSSRSLSSSRLRLSNFGFSKKHKRVERMDDSGLELTATPDTLDLTNSSKDYVRISRSEYEDIKKRVSIIESRISSEFENIVGVSMSDLELTPDKSNSNSVKIIQTAYEKTLESVEKLSSPTSDELATRLSKELKIRGSSGKKVIRSPSARKIGTIRRSRDRATKIKRNLSLNISNKKSASHQISYNNFRREAPNSPNTYNNGYPNSLMISTHESQDNFKSQLKSQAYENQRESISNSLDHVTLNSSEFGVLTRSQARRASSFHGGDVSRVPTIMNLNSNKTLDTMEWKNAETFLKDEEKSGQQSITGRPSLAKIRSQNAGMVLEKAKMFNTMTHFDNDATIKRSNRDKCQEIKKRSSSKNSTDRRLQRKNCGVQKTFQNQEMVNKDTKVCSSVMFKTDSLSSKNNVLISKENPQQRFVKENHKSSYKTQTESGKTPSEGRCGVSKLKNHTSHINSPLRERNRLASPAKWTQNTPGQVRAAVVKSISATPRRSPRQLSSKSKHSIK